MDRLQKLPVYVMKSYTVCCSLAGFYWRILAFAIVDQCLPEVLYYCHFSVCVVQCFSLIFVMPASVSKTN